MSILVYLNLLVSTDIVSVWCYHITEEENQTIQKINECAKKLTIFSFLIPRVNSLT